MIQLSKYLIVGGVNAIFTCLVYALLLNVLLWHYLISLTIAWFFGVLLTYTMNYIWVFKPEEQFRFEERFAKYVSSYLGVFVFNLLVLHLVVSTWDFDPFYSQLYLMIPIVAVNFLATKFWSLRKSYTLENRLEK